MQDGVRPGGHPARRDYSADRIQLGTSLARRIIPPFRKIQFLPALAHVALDPPRNWRDLAVPGPVRLVRMAVSASLSQGLLGFCPPQRFGITVIMRRRSRLVDPVSRAGQPDKYCEHYEYDHRGHHFHHELH